MSTANDPAFLNAVNAARLALNVAPLEFSEHLAVAAALHSSDMVARNYFAHIAPDPNPHGRLPRDRILKAGVTNTGGDQNENIASGSSDSMGTFNQWKASTKGHWETLMNPSYKFIGLGRDGNTWTANFAKDVQTTNPPPPLTQQPPVHPPTGGSGEVFRCGPDNKPVYDSNGIFTNNCFMPVCTESGPNKPLYVNGVFQNNCRPASHTVSGGGSTTRPPPQTTQPPPTGVQQPQPQNPCQQCCLERQQVRQAKESVCSTMKQRVEAWFNENGCPVQVVSARYPCQPYPYPSCWS